MGWLKKQKRRLYNLWIKQFFKSVGTNCGFGHFNQLKGAEFISVGSNTGIGEYCYLTAWSNNKSSASEPCVNIGAHCSIGAHNHITASNLIIIGDGFLSGKWVTITDNSHGNYDLNSLTDVNGWLKNAPITRPIVSKGPVVIGRNVWVGDKVTILPGVSIGDGVIIGANSVVTKDIPPYTVVGGNPAVVIKHLH